MGVLGGPNIERDGLVFGYDTGYGVADNSTSTRFYLGQPTENLIGRFVNHYSNSDYWVKATNYYLVETIVQKQADPSAPGGYYTRVKGNTDPGSNSQIFWNGGNIGIGQGSGDIDEFGEQVTVSAYLKGSGNVKLQAYDNNTGYKQGSNITLTDEWTYYSFSTTFGDGASNGNHWVGVREIGSGSSGIDDVYVAKLQWERKANATPYIQGTRSSTNSLIDLIKSTTIDVSNVSFDSNGLPTFDGTDDYMQTSLTGINLDSQCTIEGVLQRKSTPTAWRTFFNLKPSGANTPFFEFRSSANSQHIYADYYNGTDYTTNAASLTTGTYGHAIATYDGSGNIKMYFNGELIHTKTGVPSFALGTSPRLTVGRAYSNDRNTDIEAPVIKVYNRALSAQEVQQNYKAYKNRFNL